jgi:hypothetical protein
MIYTLDKSSKKFNCPKCEKKRFVRYIDSQTNHYLNENYGRCDRETSCGYFNKPPISNDKSINKIPVSHFSTLKNNVEVDYHTKELLQLSLQKYNNNNFYLFLAKKFDVIKVNEVIDKYKIGTSKHWSGATVFWQIDDFYRIRSGKILLFDKNNCKRVKTPYVHINWVHKIAKHINFNLKQCLFGLHLIHSIQNGTKGNFVKNSLANVKIALVESEKTAIIMALFLPEYIWVATGSKQNFKKDLLYPIKNYDIISFPDKSEYKDWNEKAQCLNRDGFKIKVSDYIEKIDCENGTDLADIYLSYESQEKVIVLSKNELEIKRLAEINPELLNLIETFGLCDSFDNDIDINKIKNYICKE